VVDFKLCRRQVGSLLGPLDLDSQPRYHLAIYHYQVYSHCLEKFDAVAYAMSDNEMVGCLDQAHSNSE